MGVRTGTDYLERLRDHSSQVWLRGERVDDVTTHPSLTRIASTIASLYDLQHDPAHRDVLTYVEEESGKACATACMMPKSYDDILKRGAAFRLYAERTLGLAGRTPDFLNTMLMAFAGSPEVFEEMGPKFAENLQRYFRYVRDNDLFLTHALVTPQTDRSKPPSQQRGEFLHMGVVRETDEGLVMRGARMLATLGRVADEVLVFSLPGLRPGDEAFSSVFGLPLDTPGVKLICREPHGDGGRSAFDHPLAVNFDETDALLVFDDVLVPWERVFIYNNVDLANALYPRSNLRNHTAHQTSIRGLVKMQFVVGVAMAIADAVKIDGFLHIQQKLGECISNIELVKSAIVRAEVEHDKLLGGFVRANLSPLEALRGFLPFAYARAIEVLQTLGAGGLIMLPTAEDFGSEIADDVDRYYQGASGMRGLDRTRLFKIAWDLAGDAFGTRQLQYERYYVGDPVRILARTFLAYDRTECQELVDYALALAGDPEPST